MAGAAIRNTITPRAAFELGLVYERHDKPTEAERLFKVAASSTDYYASAYAFDSLSRLFSTLDRKVEARAAQWVVVRSGQFEVAPGQALALGLELTAEQAGDEKSITCLQAATFSNDAQTSAVAAFPLADHYNSCGAELGQVVYFLRRALLVEHPFRQQAAIMLGDSLMRCGNQPGARDAYVIAANGDDPAQSQQAIKALKQLTPDCR